MYCFIFTLMMSKILEQEKIKTILKKIKGDPEPDYIKGTEKRLWENILEKSKL